MIACSSHGLTFDLQQERVDSKKMKLMKPFPRFHMKPEL